MKKLNKVCLLVASAALSTAALASNNWDNGSGDLVWKTNAGDCIGNNFLTEGTAASQCVDKAPEVVIEPQQPESVAQPTPTVDKVSYSADAFFDFDKATLKQQGIADLNELANVIKTIDLEAVVTTGHTDWTGPDAYNQKLSELRAASVKNYLVQQGIPADRVFTEGKGKAEPIADNKTREGRAKNRRVEIEVVGTKNN